MSLTDLHELEAEYRRVSAKPGEKQANFMDNFVQMPESDGILMVRLLPPKTNRALDMFCGTRLHNINSEKVHCPKVIRGERWQGDCPICDYYSWLWQESDRKPKDSTEQNALRMEARNLKPNERYYYVCVIKHQTGSFRNNKPNKLHTPLILSVGKQVHARIMRAMVGSKEDMEPSLGNVTDLETGRDFKIMKKSKKGADGVSYPYYEESKFMEPSSAGTAEQIQEWMANLHDVFALRKLLTYDELKKKVRYHRGLEKDPRGGFNPNEDLESAPELPVVKIERIESSKTLSVEDTAILEDDFLRSLDRSVEELVK